MASCSVLNTGQHAVSCIEGFATAVARSTGEHFTFQKGGILSRCPNAKQNQNLNKSHESSENVKYQSHYRPGVAQRAPGSQCSQIS